MIDSNSIASYLEKLYTQLPHDITIKVGEQTFETNRALLISHSDILAKRFGGTNTEFILEENTDLVGFDMFLDFVHKRSINLDDNKIEILLKLNKIIRAPLFLDYLALNIKNIEYQFQFLKICSSEKRPTQFLELMLASRIKEIVENWENVYSVELSQLLPILKLADLSQLPPKAVLNFCRNSILKRQKKSIEILRLFNLLLLPFDDLLILKKEAEYYRINLFDCFTNYETKHKDLEVKNKSLEKEKAILLQKLELLEKGKEKGPSLSFRLIDTEPSSSIQAITNKVNEKVSFILMTVGKSNVGKTALVYRFVSKTFSEEKIIEQDRHFDYRSPELNIYFIDINGDSELDEMRDAYILRVQCVVLVCSPDVEKSVQYIREYYEKVRKIRNSSSFPCIVCWNKSDLEKNAETTQQTIEQTIEQSIEQSIEQPIENTGEQAEEQAQENTIQPIEEQNSCEQPKDEELETRTEAENFAKSINANFIDCSSKNDKNVTELFSIAAYCYSNKNIEAKSFGLVDRVKSLFQ